MAAVKKFRGYLLRSEVLAVADTTDVSVFANATRANELVPLPAWGLFTLAALHAVFNQREVWEAFIEEGIVSYSDPGWLNEAAITSLLRRFRRKGKNTRSSNYRAIRLQTCSNEGGVLGMLRRLTRPCGTCCLRGSLRTVFPAPLGLSLTLSPAGRPGR